MEFEKLYTAEDVAEITGLTLRTIRNYIKSGRLTGRRIGVQWRFTADDINALFDTPVKEKPAVHSGNTGSPDTAVANDKADVQDYQDDLVDIDDGDLSWMDELAARLAAMDDPDEQSRSEEQSQSQAEYQSQPAEQPETVCEPEAVQNDDEYDPEEELSAVSPPVRHAYEYLMQDRVPFASSCVIVDIPLTSEEECGFLYNRLLTLASIYQNDESRRLELTYEYDRDIGQGRYVFSGAMESVCAMLNLCDVQ